MRLHRRAKWWLAGLAFSLVFWVVVGLVAVNAAEPPPCRGQVCTLTGPGGNMIEWKLHVWRAAREGKRFVVPAGWCASACVLATGLALHLKADVAIAPGAVFQVHDKRQFEDTQMPGWFRRLALQRGFMD